MSEIISFNQDKAANEIYINFEQQGYLNTKKFITVFCIFFAKKKQQLRNLSKFSILDSQYKAQ